MSIGVTVSSLDDKQISEANESDFVLLNVDWEHPGDAFRIIKAYSSLIRTPIVVGTDPPVEATADCVNAGASGIAICRTAMAESDKTSTVKAYATGLRREM